MAIFSITVEQSFILTMSVSRNGGSLNKRFYGFYYPQDASAFEEKERRSKEIVGEAIQNLKDKLRSLHGEDESIRTALAEKLAPVVKKTIQTVVNCVNCLW